MIIRNNRKTGSLKPAIREALAEYDRATVLRQDRGFSVHHSRRALTGVNGVMGATGSGKTSGPGAFLALAYLAYGFGGLSALRQARRAPAVGGMGSRSPGAASDLIIVDKSGQWRFNFLNHEAARPGEGAGLTLNIVALLEEIAQAVAGTTGRGSGDNQFWGDSLRLLITSAVDLCLFAGLAGVHAQFPRHCDQRPDKPGRSRKPGMAGNKCLLEGDAGRRRPQSRR